MGIARSVDEIFDAISYQKGASIIRMLQSFLGAEIFQVGYWTVLSRLLLVSLSSYSFLF